MSYQKRRTVDNLIKYLKKFNLRDEVSVVLANQKKREWYEVDDVILVTGEDVPIIAIEIGDAEPFDEDMVKAAEEDEADETDSVYEHSGYEEVS